VQGFLSGFVYRDGGALARKLDEGRQPMERIKEESASP